MPLWRAEFSSFNIYLCPCKFKLSNNNVGVCFWFFLQFIYDVWFGFLKLFSSVLNFQFIILTNCFITQIILALRNNSLFYLTRLVPLSISTFDNVLISVYLVPSFFKWAPTLAYKFNNSVRYFSQDAELHFTNVWCCLKNVHTWTTRSLWLVCWPATGH